MMRLYLKRTGEHFTMYRWSSPTHGHWSFRAYLIFCTMDYVQNHVCQS